MGGRRRFARETALLLVILLAGCERSETHAAMVSGGLPETAGADLYGQHCAACHGRDGRGIDERYPSLHFDAEAWAEPSGIIRQVIGGSHRRMAGPAMPDHGFLGNESLASILSHIREAFGPGGSEVDMAIDMADVASARLDLVQGFHDRAAAEEAGAGPLVGTRRSAGAWEPPPMSPAAYARAESHYEQFCTGCHGAFRTGTAGNPLQPEWMRELGTEYLRQVIGFGTNRGMPTWLDEGGLSPADVHDLAVFLQHPLPPPASMGMAAIHESWVLHRPLSERSEEPRHDYDLDQMWVVALHDPGAVLLIDGPTREPITRIPVDGPPHRISAAASGRYLQVVSRNGVVTLIDLHAAPPERVATVRVGLEARTLGQLRGGDDARLLAGADWPPQFVLLDGETLEPLQRLDSLPAELSDAVAADVGDIIGSPRHAEFAALLRGTGEVLLLEDAAPMAVTRFETEPTLRSGTLTPDGRHLLIPTDTRMLVVFDLEQRQVVTEQPLPFAGGGKGVLYEHEQHGPVWVTASMIGDQMAVVSTDSQGASAWRVIEEIDGPAPGSLFLATHPASSHLWVDAPLAQTGHASREVAVFRRDDLAAGYRSLPVAGWADLGEGPQRVLQPSYSADGSEVWMLVWNTQNADSAIVIVDDSSLEPRDVLRSSALVTPIRLYSLASLRAAAAPASRTALDATPQRGAALFRQHCAGCHGRYGEGDGPMAGHQAVVLKDLRGLAQRNEGEFPRAYARQIIDGRDTRWLHGPDGKPVWGEVFSSEGRGPDAAADTIEALLDYLEAVQR